MTIINQIRPPRTPFAPSDVLARATGTVSDAERARLIADASRTREWMLELEQRVETVGLTAAGHFKRCHDRRLSAAAESSTPDAEIAELVGAVFANGYLVARLHAESDLLDALDRVMSKISRGGESRGDS